MAHRRNGSLRRKLVLVMLPVVVLSYCITFIGTLSNTKKSCRARHLSRWHWLHQMLIMRCQQK